jgi:hypothetical protein
MRTNLSMQVSLLVDPHAGADDSYKTAYPEAAKAVHPNDIGFLRAALHLEAGPIRCVRGLKSSLVIGRKAQIGPNPFTPRGRADFVV